jgi:hypothetical protein
MDELGMLLNQSPGFFTIGYTNFLKIFGTSTQSIPFYETKPTGIAFAVPNIYNGIFREKSARITFLRKVLETNFPLLDPRSKADQIAQPGLSGRLTKDELESLMEELKNVPLHPFRAPIRYAFPSDAKIHRQWFKNFANAVGIPDTTLDVPLTAVGLQSRQHEFDVSFANVGMSDTDPISGATFLFSPTASNLDLPDGRILKILNYLEDGIGQA